ncbi:bifunctional phosphoribosyl-AMP cyclohydrolase/phosphoribosyl-ATP diphosphatase HisIE [Buchnera aphidicola]|uniref:Histidine biosynthesis bifunctional protein HisIE n=1 Tax=Buchnera aphidicola (Stegophylla sp.) TaxID=2315800 RepID=A0A4D6YK06_9GAMM|nr:bifunctional phosphoribosyl-AMP cyclohydrolase/phosphoribosyl-ATP diphosphatase HisIE [Buchnera aphidicola (Stegophylla sp.)]QCI26264.1 bifunctional phosphoribosyl-AMP cyclohydrolase/phosphoribosyl-ATP diphosphatase HisIE [Buchnera aphidicola (Stegophylla sp.)]
MLNNYQSLSIHWNKITGLLPCIIQNFISGEILMHGCMNKKALYLTQKNRIVTFYSRKQEQLWVKGERSGHFLHVLTINTDCDCDVLLILVNSLNMTCHLKRNSCFIGVKTYSTIFFYLDKIVRDKKYLDHNITYTTQLHKQGINKIAQKVGEEAVETLISFLNNNIKDCINESSDLVYHLLVLLHNHNLNFNCLISNLNIRRKND